MTTPEIDTEGGNSRAKRLKAATREAHAGVDDGVMANDPFSSLERYGAFLKVQHDFHMDVDPLFRDPRLEPLRPDLEGRRRLHLIERDMQDLGLAPAAAPHSPMITPQASLPTVLGWLYVAEGSNLGAAFLLKAAAGLGLSENHGARHLAAAPEGRGLHWRTFTAALDEIELDDAQEQEVVVGAQAAFKRVHALVTAANG